MNRMSAGTLSPMRGLVRLVAGVMLALLAATAGAQQWPTKSVRLVVPFPAGGATDILGRIVAAEMSQAYGQSFVADNRGGAGGNIGAAEVAKSAPDGYTILMGTPGTQSMNQFLYSSMPYDTEHDFAPVSYVAMVPNVLAVSPSLGVKNVKELIDLARAKPGTVNVAFPGNGTSGHMAAELFKSMAKVELQMVPYKGSAPLIQDMLGGRIQMAIDNLPPYMPHIQSGKLLALAIGTKDPFAGLPGVPTIGATVQGFEASSWFVIMAPAKTPEAIVRSLSSEIDKSLKRPAMLDKLKTLGAVAVGGTPEQLGAFLVAETKKWREVIKASGAKLE